MPESKDMEPTINWKQAIKILGCSKSHFYNLINSGELYSERSGKVKGVRTTASACREFKSQWRERQEAFQSDE